jgi:hypothetical protein
MLDSEGCAIDLSSCEAGAQSYVMGTLRIAPDCHNYSQDYPAVSTDPSSGLMLAEIDPMAMGGPGIYVAEMGVFNSDGTCIAVSNQFYLPSRRASSATTSRQGRPA